MYLYIYFRLYADIEAILANLFLDSVKQDRETGYGGEFDLFTNAL